jgi:hypothetical protein
MIALSSVAQPLSILCSARLPRIFRPASSSALLWPPFRVSAAWMLTQPRPTDLARRRRCGANLFRTDGKFGGCTPLQSKLLPSQSFPQTLQPSEFVVFVVKRYRDFVSYFESPPIHLADNCRVARRPPGPLRTGREGFPSPKLKPFERLRRGDAVSKREDADDEPGHGTRDEVRRSSWHQASRSFCFRILWVRDAR